MLNKVQIIGHVGAAPEMRYTPQGKAVATIKVAVNSGYGDKKETEWFRVVAWEKLAENCDKYVSKGQKIYIEGKLKTRSYDKDGVKHYITEIVASNVIFLDKKTEDNEKVEEEEGF